MAISVKDSGSGKRRKGTFNLPGNFEVKIEGPLDTRMVVGSITDLLDTVNIDGEPKYQYYGMLVVVSGDETPENDGLYKLIEGGDPTVIDGWEKLLSGNSNDLLPDTIFSAHTGDTSIHFTKEEISLSEIGDSAHTHTLSEITDFDNYSGSVVTQIGTKLDSSDFISHTGDTNNPHKTSFSNLTSTAHTHSISDITDLQSELNDKLDTSDFDVYTGSVKDVHVTSGIVDAQNQTIKLTKSYGGDIDILNSGALFTDTNSYVTGGTYNETTGVVTYETSSGHTFDISGFTTGITDTFVESGTLDGTTLKLTKSDGNPVNDIDLTGLKGDKGEKGDTGFVQSGMFKWDGQNTGLALQTGEFSWSGEAVYDGITSLTFHKEDADGVDQSTFLDQYLNAKSGQIKTILDAHNGHNNVFQIIGASIDGNGHYKFDVYNVSLDEIEVNGGECEVYFVLVGAEGPKGEDGTSINIIEPTPNAGELAVFKSDTKIEGDSDLTWLDSTLNISGDIIANSLTAVWQNPTNTTRDNIRILHPEGGSYSDEGEGATAPAGSIIITLPQGKIKSDSSTTGTYSMVSMSVKIYENGTNEHVLLNLAGWLHKDMVNNWYKCSAWVDSNPQYDSNFTVRFGYDRFLDKNVIIIGEPDRTWDWPDINIIDVQVGHYGQTPELWNNGWSIEIKNSWETEPHIISGTRYNVNTSGTGNDLVVFSSTQANNWSRSGSDLSYGRGNVNITNSKTLTINDYKFPTSKGTVGQLLKLNDANGNLDWIDSSELQVQSIWEENAAGDTATYDGNIVANSLSSQSTNTCRVINPEGATYYKSATATGAFIIRLPQGWTYSHINMKVKIYEYSSDEDITLNISGYNYKNDSHTNGGYWANTTAWIEGSPKDVDNHNLPVKFGYDKLLKQCIVIIGDDDYSGQLTSVYVTDVQVAGHVENDDGVKASDVSLWNSGWYIFRSNTWLDTKIEDTETNRFIFNSNTTVSNTQTNNWIRNTDDSIIYNKGTVNIGVRSISEDKLKLFVTRDDIGGINHGINVIPEIGISGSTHTALGYGSSTTNSYGIAMGTLQSTGRSWIQSKRFRWSGGEPNRTYELLLNPLGGHVGIGTTNADSALHIKGSVYNDSSIRLLNDAHNNDDYWMVGMRSFSDGTDGFEIGRNFGAATDNDLTGGKFYITNDGNVSIGNGYQPTEKLEVAGNIIADSLSTEWSTGRHGNTRILSPGGGSFSSDGEKLGAFIITLPQGGKNTMVSMTVKIYDHSKNEHITLNLAGYATSIYGQYTSAWKFPSAWIEGNPKDNHNFTVRFTYDLEEGKNVIIIGEKNSFWNFPDINIVDVQVGYDASTPDNWNDGWEIELSTDWDSVTYDDDDGANKKRYVEPNQNNAVIENTQAHSWIRNVNDVEYGNGNVNITNSKTLTINNYTLPAADGEADQVLKTDGDGNVTWENDIDTDTSIWTVNAGTATYNGIAKSDVFAFYKTRHTRIISPQGAEFRTNETEKGRIKITAPPVISSTSGSQGTQFKATIKVFSDSLNFDLHVSCYLQDYDDIHWYYAWIDSPPDGTNKYNFKVRFYYDENDKFAISIGEHTDSWRYSKVNVTEVILGHNNRDIDDWATGWNIKLDDNETIRTAAAPTALRTISATQANNWGKSGTSLKYEVGDVNITNGTLLLKNYKFPLLDGSANQVLKTDGEGNVTWENDIDTDTDTSIWSEGIELSDDTRLGLPVYSAFYKKGHVGIGTDSPQTKLHIEGDGFDNSAIRFLNKSGGFTGNADYWLIGSRSFVSGSDGFEIGRNSESIGGKLYITNTGNVSIGNGYQPTEKLEVKGNILADGGLLKVENNNRTFSVGPLNTSWTHFNTNSSNGFYFYRPISIKENIDGEVFKSENNFITVKHDGAKLEIQNKYDKSNQHPGLLITDINGDETFRAVTEVNGNSGVGVRSKVESRKGDLWLTSESNTIQMIPNSSEGPSGTAWNRRSTFESNGNLTLRGSIKIEGGSPGSGKVLTSDGSGNASWQTPSSSNGSSSSNQFAGVGTPVGSVIMWTTNSAPTGWLICDGSWVKKTDHEELYDVIGTTYGSQTVSNNLYFRLPNLESRVPVGYNSSDNNFNSIGKTGGASTHTLTENQIPHKKHRHEIGYGEDANGNTTSDPSSEHFHAISWVRDSSGEGDTLTNDQAKSVIDLFNSRKLNANGSSHNWKMKLHNGIVGVVNDAGTSLSNSFNGWAVYNPIADWDSTNANWVYTGIHKYSSDDNTNGVSNLQAIQEGNVEPDGAHGHSSEFMSTGQATSNSGGSAHNNLQPYFVMNYIICANAVESTSTSYEYNPSA